MNSMVRVENLGKLYVIGKKEAAYATLREALVGAVRAPFERFRSGRASTVETKWALRGVTFDVKRGEVLGIIGANGAGKSTILKVLSRITDPTEGSVDLYGRVGSLLEVGTGFHAELTGRENVYLNGSIIGMSHREIQRKFDEIVAFAEVEQYIDTPVKRYSSGMQVRLAFAVAAPLEPEILIIDEVLAVGDAAFQRKCLGKMGDVARQGRTVLFVSHDLASVRHLCERVLLIRDGKLAMDGDAATVVDAYVEQAHGDARAWSVDTARLNVPGTFRITGLDFLHSDRTVLRQLQTGQPLIVRIGYSVAPGSRVPFPAFDIHFKTRMGAGVLRLNNDVMSGFSIPMIEGNGSVELVLPVFPFAAGEYVIDLVVGRKPEGRFADLKGIGSISVAARDVYSTGVGLTQASTLSVTPHRWVHAPESGPSVDSGWIGASLNALPDEA